MRLREATVLGLVRSGWWREVDAVEHLPVGFGAHHWKATSMGSARLFVTFDTYGARHTAESLEDAYAAAAELAFPLDFVVAGLQSSAGTYTLPVAGGALSVTPWVWGEPAGDGPPASRAEAEATARMLARLHATRPPTRTSRWRPLVPASFADTLVEQTATPWDSGPHAATARDALRDHASDVRRWTATYHRLAEAATDRPWVATHGEPHTRNQLTTLVRTLLVDWESLKVAPRERDLRDLVAGGHADLVEPDWEMVELFDLEWRLQEIEEYATWFAAPHTGTESDRVALAGLLEEVDRPDWTRP